MDMPKAGHGGRRTETECRGVLHKLGGIEHDGKRAIVDKRYGHIGTEPACLNRTRIATHQVNEMLVELVGAIGGVRGGNPHTA